MVKIHESPGVPFPSGWGGWGAAGQPLDVPPSTACWHELSRPQPTPDTPHTALLRAKQAGKRGFRATPAAGETLRTGPLVSPGRPIGPDMAQVQPLRPWSMAMPGERLADRPSRPARRGGRHPAGHRPPCGHARPRLQS